ncbi:MAG: hypothetical protein JW807_11165 [Spirochaetes bacterium]|nr:hypothetical protein [Spirochaetota bacterium]
MNTLEQLLNTIYADIRKRNTGRGLQAIPCSDEFFGTIAKSYSLVPFAIPKLIKILVDSHKIFSFKLADADRKQRTARIDGFVVTEGPIIKSLLDFLNDELVRAYSQEFSAKYSVERIIKEILPKLDAYNNTHLGRTTNIVISLMGFQSTLERNIMQYGQKWQEKQMREEIEKSDPISSFIDSKGAMTASVKDEESYDDSHRRATDTQKYEELKKYMSKNSIGKTINVYGVEFYTRVCFREYQFLLVQKLIEDGHIHKREDLNDVKTLLRKTRSNSDQDTNLQKYAHDINDLEKLINSTLKKAEAQ